MTGEGCGDDKDPGEFQAEGVRLPDSLKISGDLDCLKGADW